MACNRLRALSSVVLFDADTDARGLEDGTEAMRGIVPPGDGRGDRGGVSVAAFQLVPGSRERRLAFGSRPPVATSDAAVGMQPQLKRLQERLLIEISKCDEERANGVKVSSSGDALTDRLQLDSKSYISTELAQLRRMELLTSGRKDGYRLTDKGRSLIPDLSKSKSGSSSGN
jgi:hypothetical protein